MSQEPNQSYPYAMQWNNVEHSFGSSTSVLISYVGSRGIHLGGPDVNLNQLPNKYNSLAPRC